MIDFLADFSQNFSERALFVLENSIMVSITKNWHSGTGYIEKPCLFRADFNHDFKHDFNHNFLHSGTPV